MFVLNETRNLTELLSKLTDISFLLQPLIDVYSHEYLKNSNGAEKAI